MDRHYAVRIIHETLVAHGFTYSGPGPLEYEGQLKVHGKPVDVSILIPDVRFATNPIVSLRDRSQIPITTLAHVEEGNGICYSGGPGLPADLYSPGGAVLRVLEEARHTLELSYRGRGLAELVDEYQHYWKMDSLVRCMLRRGEIENGTEAGLYRASVESKFVFNFIAKEPTLRGYSTKRLNSVVFLTTDKRIGPSAGMIMPSNLGQLLQWLEAQNSLTYDVEKMLNLLSHERIFFLTAPNALVGFRAELPAELKAADTKRAIRPAKRAKLLRAMADKTKIRRYAGKWSSLADVTDRNNMAQSDLSGKSIALVGCGTIGGHLARMLAQCGAGNAAKFSLFDHDILTQGNVGRHLLGFADIGKPKARAVATEIERFHPQLTVTPYVQDAMENVDILAWHDLVIDATGDWNIQSALNDWFLNLASDRPSALLHCWVFKNGAGVQSFLNMKDEYSCFRCLKPKFDGPWRYPAGNQKSGLTVEPATCGDGSYIPFTVDVSCNAAALATRAALDWANGRPGQRLRTIATDYETGIQQNPCSPKAAVDCPACAESRKAK